MIPDDVGDGQIALTLVLVRQLHAVGGARAAAIAVPDRRRPGLHWFGVDDQHGRLFGGLQERQDIEGARAASGEPFNASVNAVEGRLDLHGVNGTRRGPGAGMERSASRSADDRFRVGIPSTAGRNRKIPLFARSAAARGLYPRPAPTRPACRPNSYSHRPDTLHRKAARAAWPGEDSFNIKVRQWMSARARARFPPSPAIEER